MFLSKPNEHAPKKTKWVRGNNTSHMNKFLRRAIMKRSKLKNKANKMKHPGGIKMYKKQFHLSIIPIKKNIHHNEKLSFRFVTLEDVRLVNN